MASHKLERKNKANQLKRLDRIQYRALICLGAAKSTPINALLVEANEMPKNLRKVILIYWKYMKSYIGNHINTELLKNCWEYVNKKERGFSRG